MPLRVPTEGIQEQVLQLPGAVQLGDEGLGAIAAGTAEAAGQMREHQIELDRKRNATMVFEAEVKLADAYRAVETAARQRQGSNAHGVAGDIQSWWEEQAPSFEADLENETQRTLFNESVQRRRAASLDAFSTFEAQQTNSAVDTSARARINSAINAGAANFASQESVDVAREEIIGAVGVQAAIAGWSPDVHDAALQEHLTGLHSQVIQNMLDVSPTRAREYFEANKDEINGSEHDTINKMLQDGTDIANAQRLSDDIWSRDLTEPQALAAARAEAEGPMREQALALLRQQYAEQRAAVERSNEAFVDSQWGAFDAGGMAALTPSAVAELQRIDPRALRTMRETPWTPRDQINTNWDVYYGTIQFAQNDRAGFADLDLRHLRNDLNPREYDVLAQMQKDVIEGIASPTGTLTQMLGEVAWESDDDERRGMFERTVRENIATAQRAKGAPLSEAETRLIIDEQLMNVSVPNAGWFYLDAEKPRFELTDEDQVNIEYHAIPEDIREEAEEDLEAMGRDPSQANVVQLYRLFLQYGNQ